MQTIKTGEFVELTIKKSKFISVAINVSTKKDVEAILKEMHNKFSDATHICYAYKILENSEIFEKTFDDSEPSSTAGKPILNVINKHNLINVLIVVIRYFGGIKLGAGGLVRAYSNASINAINNTEILELRKYLKIKVSFSYENLNFIFELIKKGSVILLKKEDNFFEILVLAENLDLINLIKSKAEKFESAGEFLGV